MGTIRRARGAALGALITSLTLVAGCATTGPDSSSTRGWLDGEPSRQRAAKDAAGAGGEAMTSDASAAAPEPAGGMPPDTPVRDSQASAALRAGSVDDNERFEEYLLYRQDTLRAGMQVHDVDIRGRKIVTVRNRSGRPVVGATVRVRSGSRVVAEALTHADGRAFVFLPMGDDRQQRPTSVVAEVERDGVRAEAPVTGAPDVAVTLAVGDPAPPALDVMFVIDATGSMGDEIEQLKANVISISDRLAALPSRPDVRFATTVFRDRGDAFVTRTFDFTTDVKAFQGALRAVVADGGGDTPESVNAALHDAIHKPSWRGGPTVSLAFLVGDAAPHLDYADDSDYAVEVFEAAERGIKIEPIASSRLDDQGEFVFRQLAQLTGGRFSFLTYGAAGAPEPGDTTTHHVDDYSVLSLDELVVRLVSEELTPLVRSGQL
jgi:von Willebrand factor type A domain